MQLPAESQACAAAPFDPDDFDYTLPDELIARHPCRDRSGARLMHVGAGGISHRRFCDLPLLLAKGDLLVLNDTRVRKARLRGEKAGGAKVGILVERIGEGGRSAAAMVQSNGRIREGDALLVGDARLMVASKDGRRCVLESDSEGFEELLERLGEVPIPLYLGREATPEDLERYQTVYARETGSCAAPTAGLHFTQELLDSLGAAKVAVATLTLHVGFGTFLPVGKGATELHPEHFSIPDAVPDAAERALRTGRRVVAGGTTTLRALESGGGGGETRLFIRPGFQFRQATTLLTNFHLPRSSLFALVCAFGGTRRMRSAYAEAIKCRYRFFSYGDAMLIERT